MHGDKSSKGEGGCWQLVPNQLVIGNGLSNCEEAGNGENLSMGRSLHDENCNSIACMLTLYVAISVTAATS